MAGLQFNDTSGKLGLLQDCEYLLNFNDGDITSNATLKASFTRSINSYLQKVVTMIFQSKDEWDWDDISNSDYPIATTSLVANQQDYTLPTSLNMEKIKRVEVSFDGGTTWKRCMPFDINQTDSATDLSSLKNNFSQASPFYDIEFNALKLYPLPTANSTNGLKMWFFRSAVEFVVGDTTKQPPLDVPFHRMLSIGAAYEFSTIKNLPQRDVLKGMFDDYEARLKQHYGSKDEDRRVNLGTIYDTSYGS